LYGYFIFANNRGTDINNYLNALADTFSGSAGNTAFDDNWTYTAEYLQDSWKVNRRLTLDLGLRYEIQAGPYKNNHDTMALRSLAAAGRNTERSLDTNNLGPRVGFVYDLSGDGRQIARGGYGRYYDEIFQNITLYEYWSDVKSPTFFISTAPTFTPNQYKANPDAIRNSFADPSFAGTQIRLTSPDLKQPSADQFNFGWSGQVSPRIGIDVDYVHSEGHDEIHRWRVNTVQNVNTRISPAGVFNPVLGPFIVEGNRGHSRFDGLYVTGKVRMDKASVFSTYTWSTAKNLANDFNTLTGDITNANWDIDYGPSPNDIRHRFTTGAVFQLPKGVQYSTSLQANTGKPYNPISGLGGISLAVRAINPATGKQFDRNSFRADGLFSWDMRFSKVIGLGGAKSLELMFDVFNITNHANFDVDHYLNTYTSPNFGQPTSILQNSQRQSEFGLRFKF
jgi:hypothetical protein